MQSTTLTIGCRTSPLALAQTRQFLKQWQSLCPQLNFKIETFQTTGDKMGKGFLSEVGGKGLFIKELEEALLQKKIDVAVHSLKDVPATLPEGFCLLAYPKRESPWDVLISQEGRGLQELPQKAVVGTSSLRRRAQLKTLRPDLEFSILRGNIDTRLKKLSTQKLDAIVLAQAGMKRLGLNQENAKPLEIIPAPGQGVLAVEGLSAREDLPSLVEAIHHPRTAQCALAERKIMAAMGGGCDVPLGVYAEKLGEHFELKAFLALPDASKVIEEKLEGEDVMALADLLVEKLFAHGADEILRELGH